MVSRQSNVERLEAAGVISKTPLPDAYQSIIEELDDADVDAIIRLKGRLDEVEYDAKEPYATYFVPL